MVPPGVAAPIAGIEVPTFEVEPVVGFVVVQPRIVNDETPAGMSSLTELITELPPLVVDALDQVTNKSVVPGIVRDVGLMLIVKSLSAAMLGAANATSIIPIKKQTTLRILFIAYPQSR